MKRLMIIGLVLCFLIVLSGINGEQKGNLEQILTFEKGQIGTASLNNRDDSLLISSSVQKGNDWENSIYWYKNSKIIKKIQGVNSGEFSPDGKYYTYVKNKFIYVLDEHDKLINKLPFRDLLEFFTWSYDSKYIYISEQGNEYIISRFNIKSGRKEEILKSKKIYFHPVTVNNINTLYLLRNRRPEESDYDCDLVRYDLQLKKFEDVKLPLENYTIYDTFAISPNEKIVLVDNGDWYIYICDISKSKIIDKIKILFNNSHTDAFRWKRDSTYLIFTMNGEQIFKYTIPKN